MWSVSEASSKRVATMSSRRRYATVLALPPRRKTVEIAVLLVLAVRFRVTTWRCTAGRSQLNEVPSTARVPSKATQTTWVSLSFLSRVVPCCDLALPFPSARCIAKPICTTILPAKPNADPSPSTTTTTAAPTATGASDEGDGQGGTSPSWLTKAAAGSSDRSPPGTAGVSSAEGNTRAGGTDWLAVAASGGPRVGALSSSRPTPSPARKSEVEAKAAARRVSGGGWMMAAAVAGKLGLAPENGGDGIGHKNNDANGMQGKKAGGEAQSGPGGWMATAISSGRLGAAPSGDNSAAFEDEPASASQGVTLGTQTDDNFGKAVAVPAKPKLPPWAKPWSPPPPVVMVDPVSTPAAEVAADKQNEPSPNQGTEACFSMVFVTSGLHCCLIVCSITTARYSIRHMKQLQSNFYTAGSSSLSHR